MIAPADADILERIVAAKVDEIREARAARPFPAIDAQARAAGKTRGFENALRAKIATQTPAIIAEIKRASPSRGVLREAFDPPAIAEAYARAGAACLSVLTDQRFFQGSPEHLSAARSVCRLPVLRKDFMLDRYQVAQSRAMGADAILLIVALLGDEVLASLEDCAREYGMDVLVEVHDGAELERALNLKTRLIGINNRNLRTFTVGLETTFSLLPSIPADRLVVTESGITRREDIARLREKGVNAFLVGEAFMRAPDPGQALKQLFGG